MDFRVLNHTTLSEVLRTFNQSFSDYVIPLQLTEDLLIKKMKNDGINLELSAGAFEEDKLAGFILNGTGVFNGIPTAYNGGTGVIPSKRGNKITARLYEFILPSLKKAQVEQCLLEVITSNGPAIKVYENIGFEKTRELICFKGSPVKHPTPLLQSFSLNESESLNSNLYGSFQDWNPSWQNSWTAIERSQADLKIITAERNEQTVAYIIYDPATARISQFAVKQQYRNQGLGTLLFQELHKRLKKDISILNIDAKAYDTISFLKSVGLKSFINQYEMIMNL